jgi:4-amino-4-deoxy-L-arabinose transferase-like glycosyltransferase
MGQALYGGLLTKLFSPRFMVLRISTLLLSCLTAVLLWMTFLRIGFRKPLAGVLLLAWIFNPLQFNLSFTYMTEIPFLFFVALATYLYGIHLDTRRFGPLILSAATLGYAFLIRQTALICILALICSVLADSGKNRMERIRQAAAAAGAAGVLVIGYFLWVVTHGGATAAVHRKFELLPRITSKQIVGNADGMLFYLAFMLLPVWMFLIPVLCRLARSMKRKIMASVLIAWAVLTAAGLWWFAAHGLPGKYLPSAAYHARMPFLLNVLYDTGLGPITLEPDYFGPPPTPTYPKIWIAVTAVLAVGTVISGSLCTFGLIRWRWLRSQILHLSSPLIVFAGLAFLGIVLLEITFSHLQEGGLFDRHILVVAFPFGLLLGLFSSEIGRESTDRYFETPALLATAAATAALVVFCVSATHDYMEWNRIRLDFGRGLLVRGVDPLSIVGGFEFDAWHNYDSYIARGILKNTRRWWYDRRDYIITMNPQQGYKLLQKRTYFSWVRRRPIALYLMVDNSVTNAIAP